MMKINNIRTKIILLFLAIFTLSTTSCVKELEELNSDPNAIEELPYGIQLTRLQLYLSGTRYEMRRASLGWAMSAIQQFADVNISTSLLPGDKYIDFLDYSSSLFDRAFTNEYKDLADYMARVSEDPEAINYHAAGRVMRVLSFHRTTDLYGDIPYFEAGLGYLNNEWTPSYDSQEEIYNHMLMELEEAALEFSNSAPSIGSQDLFYGGDITKWKKLSYSLMLRLGLRLVKVDPAAAELWVSKAIVGGVMTDLNDVVKTEHQIDGGWINTNPYGEAFEIDKFMRLSDTFVSWMQDHGDPRLEILSFVESGGPHQGLPNGLDPNTLETMGPAGGDLANYSQLNQALVQRDSPFMFMTYAEVEFMLAEAAVRGWYSGDAQTHYNNGVRAAMENWSFYGVTTPTTAAVDAYLAANPFDAANAIEMIGEQYWAATFLNPWEGYANWRRIEYPVLTPVNYPGNATGGTIPRRLKYPDTEYTLNEENVRAAEARQGPNSYTTRIWWDKN
ncbi:SusD/RagB family nutrient-binding outer membrane lipoprotein [Zhouia amylolytica]|uniref:SusD/RagB family nutrient-binding outer membrane lipoprotein n=1 Tax=Zhouia amylolytica TaxID=376730 RepID=UPI0020CEAB90|nr:SusD/RagB family nutrient-binding outer membrane lipoprotein [Zhouia amylolytica]MCQ0112767.1 SusD/RagB family nutrient-binding outer membrane lipoprotein [Zhouia amylolytica]